MPAGWRSHSERATATPSAWAADSGYWNGATGEPASSRHDGVPAALITTASTGLSEPAASTVSRIAAATSSAPATTGGTKRTISASSRLSASSGGIACA